MCLWNPWNHLTRFQFDSYYKAPKKSRSPTESAGDVSFLGGYRSNFILLALGASSLLESIAEDSRKELCDYLESPRDINVKDPIKWWGVGYLF